jgi:hypothetical protein
MTDRSKDDLRDNASLDERKSQMDSGRNCQTSNTFYETHRFEVDFQGNVKKESFISQGSEIVEFRSDNEEFVSNIDWKSREVRNNELIFDSDRPIPSCCLSMSSETCEIF